MSVLTIYTSQPASYNSRVFAEYLAATLEHPVLVLPLSEMPKPLPERLAPLRLERDELCQELAVIGWHLEQYASGLSLPDACHENGLLADREAKQGRLRAVVATLAAVQKGGLANG
ncbi:hypothetical protein GO988_11325 [Hymenobacter sp. HMF4947]|uniref:Uncharacterized protein n=1 Tax=Hymenobacter ginkgonis TaxID=2682976 RepID=A0A7K1TET6_9BACT|nr:hypothetical protein [Hymenobacter ginkgonis]MVN76915.1 hypothetical protein [Hymenobacter ginkgonis]